MAAGRPVICLDLGGPGQQVTPETGIKIEASSPGQAVTGIAQAMLRLDRDRALLTRLGSAGRLRAQSCFRWSDKPGQVLELFARAAASRLSE